MWAPHTTRSPRCRGLQPRQEPHQLLYLPFELGERQLDEDLLVEAIHRVRRLGRWFLMIGREW